MPFCLKPNKKLNGKNTGYYKLLWEANLFFYMQILRLTCQSENILKK